MALLAREALKNPDFAEICSKPSMTVRFGNPPYARTLTNTNKLLKMDSTVIGVKTGFTDAAGRCLVSAAERDGRRLICVTLFDRDDWNDHERLYDYGFSLAADYPIALPETLSVPAEGGSETVLPVYAKTPLTLTAWNGVPPSVTAMPLLPPFVTAPVAKGDVIGELVYSGEHGEIARLPLCAARDAEFQESPPKKRRSFLEWLRKVFQRG